MPEPLHVFGREPFLLALFCVATSAAVIVDCQVLVKDAELYIHHHA
jgi:hypothetical protein